MAVVPHTHWDREWYEPFQTFRLKLVRLIDDLLDQMEQDSSYRHFLLDGQLAVMSSRSGFLRTSETLYARCDLKLVLLATNRAAVSEIYCKVMEDAPGELGWRVRFSSAVAAY